MTTEQSPAFDLKPLVSHVTAPWWYLEKRGFRDSGFAILCPVCGSQAIKIVVRGDATDCRGSHYLIYFPEAGVSAIDTTDGHRETVQEDPRGRGLSVSIPMQCDRGHGWLLDIGQVLDLDQHRCQVSVSLDSDCYDELFPDLVQDDPLPPAGWEWVGEGVSGHWAPQAETTP